MESSSTSWRVAGLVLTLMAIFTGGMAISMRAGGHMAGPTHIDPGNVGLVIDDIHGKVEPRLLSSGTPWLSIGETSFEIPTQQQTIALDGDNAVLVNTSTNMLKVDVSVQYTYDPGHVIGLYDKYQTQFEDQKQFEQDFIIPDVKSAISIAIGDEDTITSTTTAGKTDAELVATKQLKQKWEAEGINFSNVAIRAIEQDDATKAVLSSMQEKQQDILNEQVALKQQLIDNQTILLNAKKEAAINAATASTLTDLYVDNALLDQTHTIYINSNDLLSALKSK